MAVSFLKKAKKKGTRLFVLTLLLLPLWMWMAWHFTPKRKLIVAIIDKTVLTSQRQEHLSLSWVLNQERYTRNTTDLYQRDRDYYGFFPLTGDKFRLKGLERFSEEQLQRLSNDADAAYLTDAYGVYNKEWYTHNGKEQSGIVYGGMSPQDLYFLELMKARHKLIITEFNCLAPPTTDLSRWEFEKSFGVFWTGWTGRHFDSFDTTVNKDLPGWLIGNYRKQHNGKWPFKRGGIAFVHKDARIVVLEDRTHLNREFPYIFCGKEGQVHYGLPESIRYTYWFDIIHADTGLNRIIATYKIDVNAEGRKELRAGGIEISFPAIIAHLNKDYRFFYFAGDFCNNPIGFASSHFKGASRFSLLMYNRRDPEERAGFFWKVYRPLVTQILNDHYSQKDGDHLGK